jgi:molecular chaperone GrpE
MVKKNCEVWRKMGLLGPDSDPANQLHPFKKQAIMTEKDTQAPEQETGVPEQEIMQEPDAQPTTAPDAHRQALETAQKELEEMRSNYLYLLSDFETFKRNASRERLELIQTASRELMTALLPVLDDFDRAAKNDGGLPEGVALVHHKLLHILQTKGLKPVELKPGDDFNADTQEAVAEIPAASEEAVGKIVDVLEKGFFLGDRIVRFAKVVVGK